MVSGSIKKIGRMTGDGDTGTNVPPNVCFLQIILVIFFIARSSVVTVTFRIFNLTIKDQNLMAFVLSDTS